jgi:hypothetical protein
MVKRTVHPRTHVAAVNCRWKPPAVVNCRRIKHRLLTTAGVKSSFTCVNRKYSMSEKQFSTQLAILGFLLCGPSVMSFLFDIYFSHPMSFLARPIFFQFYPRDIPDYIFRIAPVHRTETDLHVIVVFIIFFNKSLYMFV